MWILWMLMVLVALGLVGWVLYYMGYLSLVHGVPSRDGVPVGRAVGIELFGLTLLFEYHW